MRLHDKVSVKLSEKGKRIWKHERNDDVSELRCTFQELLIVFGKYANDASIFDSEVKLQSESAKSKATLSTEDKETTTLK